MCSHGQESERSRAATGLTRYAVRLRWYLRALGFHPLIRAVDRLEALVVVGMLAIALLAVPVAMTARTYIRDAGLTTVEEQVRTRHAVSAVVVAGVGLPTSIDTPALVRAQWHEGNRERTESVAGLATAKPGDHTTVWLDDDGKVVPAPLQPGDAELQALVAAATVWAFLAAGGVLTAFLVIRGLDRARDRAWDRELRLLTHNDDGWANRHI